jgi:PAS domain S-box-containing protein
MEHKVISQPLSIDARELLAALVTSSDDAIITKDLDGIITSWNPAAERMFGYSAAEAIGRSVRMIIPPERQGEEDDVLARVRTGHKIDHFETTRQRKDGTLVPVSLTVSPVRDPGGIVVGASKIARDLTQQQARQRDSERLAAIVESSDDAIASKDLNGVIRSWNRAAERMFGYTAAEAIGQSIRMVIPADRQSEEDDVLARLRRGEKIDHFETVRQRKDGTLFPISLTVSPIRDASGEVVGASKVARDLSPLRNYATMLEQQVKERTAALESANTQLEAFAYSVSHDLRAPLRGMQGLSQALLEDYGTHLDETARDYASRIVRESALLDRLIQDLLAYSRLTRVEVAVEHVDLNNVLDASLKVLGDDIATKRAEVIVEGALPPVRGNRAVLVQVVTNLVSNAVKFGGDGPVVRVRTSVEGAMIRLWVEDQGIGIEPEHQERIFRVFERLHGTESYPGTGIGLAIVRRGAERLGGRAGVESALGKGARFWVEIPSAEAK